MKRPSHHHASFADSDLEPIAGAMSGILCVLIFITKVSRPSESLASVASTLLIVFAFLIGITFIRSVARLSQLRRYVPDFTGHVLVAVQSFIFGFSFVVGAACVFWLLVVLHGVLASWLYINLS